MKANYFVLCFFLIIVSLNANAQNSDLVGVQIGGMTWMTRNLEETKFRNGDRIPQAQSDEEWQEAGFNKKPAWCYYIDYTDSGPKEVVNRGKLYNSYAVNDPRGLAPEGWHIPTVSEWNLLESKAVLEGEGIVELFSKEHWTGAQDGWNVLGLSISPDGWRDVGCGGLDSDVSFWGSTKYDDETAVVSFYLDEQSVGEMQYRSTSWIMGYYVRCVKD
jgi:uncharacterized protein (TIGR02145 family)